MFAPMSPLAERTRISNERQLNAAQTVTTTLPQSSRFAVLMLTLRRTAARRPAAVPATAQPCTEQA